MQSEPAPAGRAEEHFFFEPASIDGPLYARLHLPINPLDTGVVVVPPIGRERIRICHEMSFLGRDVAAAGFPVLRFDYRGEGESAGEFRQSSVTSRIADTVAAVEELRRLTGVRRVALVGIHLGALIAGLAAREAGADRLILCDPVSATQSYVSNLFRAVIFQQSQYFGRAAALEPELRARLRSGEVVTIYAFQTGAALIDELEALDMTTSLREFSGASAILYFSTREAMPPPSLDQWGTLLGGPSRCVVAPVVMNFSWTTRKRWTPRLEPLNRAIVDWLHSRQQQGDCRELSAADEA